MSNFKEIFDKMMFFFMRTKLTRTAKCYSKQLISNDLLCFGVAELKLATNLHAHINVETLIVHFRALDDGLAVALALAHDIFAGCTFRLANVDLICIYTTTNFLLLFVSG